MVEVVRVSATAGVSEGGFLGEGGEGEGWWWSWSGALQADRVVKRGVKEREEAVKAEVREDAMVKAVRGAR